MSIDDTGARPQGQAESVGPHAVVEKVEEELSWAAPFLDEEDRSDLRRLLEDALLHDPLLAHLLSEPGA